MKSHTKIKIAGVFIIGVSIFLFILSNFTFAQSDQQVILKCAGWIKDADHDPLFDDVRETDPYVRATNILSFLDETSENFFPRRVIRKREFEKMAQRYVSIAPNMRLRVSFSNKKVTVEEAAKFLSKIFDMPRKNIVREINKNYVSGKWVRRHEAATMLYNLAQTKLEETVEEATCKSWSEKQPQDFVEEFGETAGEESVGTSARIGTSTSPVGTTSSAGTTTQLTQTLVQQTNNANHEIGEAGVGLNEGRNGI